MIQAITKTNFTAFIQTEDNRIDTSVVVAQAQIGLLFKFTNDMDKSIQYAYGQGLIFPRYSFQSFTYHIITDVYTGKVNLEPAGYWKYEVYEVSWIGTKSLSLGKAPVTETDILPVHNDNGVVQGLVTKGKMYVDEKEGTEQVQYTQHSEPSGTNYVFYGTPQFSKYSCTFDGVDDFIAINDSAVLRPTGDITISLWMKPSNWNMPTPNTQEYALGCVYSGGWGIKIINSGSGATTLQFEIKTASGVYIYSTVDTTTTEAFTGWKNIIASYQQSTGQAFIWHNNDLTGVTAGIGTPGDAISYNASPLPICIGADADIGGAADSFFEGAIDDVAIFNTGWPSAAQREEIYNYGKPDDLAQMAGLVGYWRMGDPDGQSSFPTIVDVTTNGNDGTMENMIAADITSDVP